MTGSLRRSIPQSVERAPSEVRVIGESTTVVSADHGGLIRVWGLDFKLTCIGLTNWA